MGFVEEWNRAIANDESWQFEELLEEDPELAEFVWYVNIVAMLAYKGLQALGICVSYEEVLAVAFHT